MVPPGSQDHQMVPPGSKEHQMVPPTNTYNTSNLNTYLLKPSPSGGENSQNSVETSEQVSANIDIPLHELIGAAVAVEAELESLQKKATTASDKPKNMACTTSCSINSSRACSHSWESTNYKLQSVTSAESTDFSSAINAEPADATHNAVENFSGTHGKVKSAGKMAVAKAVAERRNKKRKSDGRDRKSAKELMKKPKCDPKELENCLSETCDSWFMNERLRDVGYPLNKIFAGRSRSPSPPRLDNESGKLMIIRLLISSNWIIINKCNLV